MFRGMAHPGRPRGATTALDERGLKRLLTRMGKNLRAIREDRGLTQEQLAEIVDLDVRYYQRVETGHVNLTLGLLAKIAGRLKVEAASLIAAPAERKPSARTRA